MFTTLIENQAQARNTRHVEGVGFLCSQCWTQKPVGTSCGTGYGYNKENQIVCYECCGKIDESEMKANKKHFGYLVQREGRYFFTNWPATLNIPVHVRKSFHNFAGRDGRRDFWFTAYGKSWHGVNIGDNECATIRALKH